MSLGPHTIGLRKREPTGEKTRHNVEVMRTVDVEVSGCLVTPSRAGERGERDDRVTPRIAGLQLLAPPGTDLDVVDAVIWPITGRDTVGGRLVLTGRLYEVDGEAGIWEECVEAELRRSS